jgi:hypothetical protein
LVTEDWLLLIYTVPSHPSRKRAYVWRELKKLGALYVRDGVALLPARPGLEQRLAEIAERIQEYEGEADLVRASPFSPARRDQLVQRFQDERTTEYREIHHACARFLRDVLEEVDADDFSFPDVDNLEGELSRLHRWEAQIQERDYFQAPGRERVEELLAKCDRAFERFAAEAARRTGPRPEPEDVFDRLGGSAPPGGDVPV